jgi:hypothetical protein
MGLGLDWAYEAVALAGDGFYEAGLVCMIVQGFAQAVHCFVQALVEVNKSVGCPQLFHQRVASDQLAGTIEQRGEDVKRLLLKEGPVAVGAEFAGAQVELELAKTHGRFGFGGSFHHALLQLKSIRESLTPDYEDRATK